MGTNGGSTGWNPWHGCTKISSGCRNCYVYRQDARYGSGLDSRECHKNKDFDLPVRRNRDGSYKISPGETVFTCFTSDFLLSDADAWRADCWQMIRERSDCIFIFFTKRIHRLASCLPPDWGSGYKNVIIGCTVENQEMANLRLPVFLSLPICHRIIVAAPLLSAMELSPYLSKAIEEVTVGGESGQEARPCHYEWILSLQRQCMDAEVPFRFHQTGAKFVKNGKTYSIPRRLQKLQAHKAGLDFGTVEESLPLPLPPIPEQITMAEWNKEKEN